MSETEWWEGPWDARASELSVWVLENSAEHGVIEQGLRDMGFEDGKQMSIFMREYLQQQECTYVALGLRRPMQDGWQITCVRCRVAVGCAAHMWGGERSRLQEILVDILKRWRTLEPSERPMQLTRHRRAEVLSEEEKR